MTNQYLIIRQTIKKVNGPRYLYFQGGSCCWTADKLKAHRFTDEKQASFYQKKTSGQIETISQ